MVEKQGAAQTAARGANSVGPRARVWLAVAALLLFTFLALDSLVGDSPTMDEQNHIARGPVSYTHLTLPTSDLV